jgi:hypothetical protein
MQTALRFKPVRKSCYWTVEPTASFLKDQAVIELRIPLLS